MYRFYAHICNYFCPTLSLELCTATLTHTTHHVYMVVILQDSHAEEKREQKLVLFKERPADITVQAEGEVLINIIYSLFQVI